MDLVVVRLVRWCKEFDGMGTLVFDTRNLLPAMEMAELALNTVNDTVRAPGHHLEAVLKFMLCLKRRAASFRFRRRLADRHHHLRKVTCLRVPLSQSSFTLYTLQNKLSGPLIRCFILGVLNTLTFGTFGKLRERLPNLKRSTIIPNQRVKRSSR